MEGKTKEYFEKIKNEYGEIFKHYTAYKKGKMKSEKLEEFKQKIISSNEQYLEIANQRAMEASVRLLGVKSVKRFDEISIPAVENIKNAVKEQSPKMCLREHCLIDSGLGLIYAIEEDLTFEDFSALIYSTYGRVDETDLVVDQLEEIYSEELWQRFLIKPLNLN